MRMPHLQTLVHPSTSRRRNRVLLLSLVTGLTVLGANDLSAQTSDADIAQLRAQMQQMQEDNAKMAAQMQQMHENNAKMAAQMKSMEAQVALSASIAKSRTLTGPDGKAISLEGGPVVIPALDTFTRNFKWHGYARLGTGFTGNGVGQTSDFRVPDIPHGRFRLGNENDLYIETGPILSHMLGDDPDVIDARFKMTFRLESVTDKQTPLNLDNTGWNVGIVEAFFEFKNVIKSAPEVTFWGGQRFYDRYDIHPQDYFFLNTSGVGGGAYNIDLGIGSLAIAYFGGIRSGTGAFTFGGNDQTDDFNQFNLQVNGGQGSFYRHTLDIRLGDIDVFSGKLKLVLLGAYQQGGRFTTGRGGEGHVPNSGGVGGGAIYQYDLPARFGKKSFIQIAALYGWGLIDFDRSSVELNKLGNAYNSALAQSNDPVGTFKDVDPYNNSQRARANIFWVWNPTDNFSLGTWATYQFDDQGFTSYQVDGNGSISSASPYLHLFTAGIRPVYWIWGPFAIQGSFGYSYLSNNRRTGAAFGDGGSLGVFSIAPTIKPRGGFFTRPELRLYATYAVWSDSLKGSIGSPYYANNNDGWNFGIQAEAWW